MCVSGCVCSSLFFLPIHKVTRVCACLCARACTHLSICVWAFTCVISVSVSDSERVYVCARALGVFSWISFLLPLLVSISRSDKLSCVQQHAATLPPEQLLS